MRKKYYKVVGDDLISARIGRFSTSNREGLPVQYRIGEWVEPNLEKTDLMVFDNLRLARNFANSWECIFECEVKSPRKIGNLIVWNLTMEKLKTIVGLRKAKKRWTHLVKPTEFPRGTVFCSAVKLVKRVSRYE